MVVPATLLGDLAAATCRVCEGLRERTGAMSKRMTDLPFGLEAE